MLFDFGKYEQITSFGIGVILTIVLFATGLFTKIIEIAKNSIELLEKSNTAGKEDKKKLEENLEVYKVKYQEALIEVDSRKLMNLDDVKKLAECSEKNRRLEDENVKLKKELSEVYDKLLKENKKGLGE